MEIVVSTRNKDKFREISRILKDHRISPLSLENFPRAPKNIKEDGKTFSENACKKALKVAYSTKYLTVADDSGLEVEFLNGAPGIFSARFAGKDATYNSNNEKLLKLLKDVPDAKRRAKFICCVAIADKDGIVDIVEGKYSGCIGLKAKGTRGFGYDPIFYCPRLGKTFAQLNPDLKNKVSHRAKAFAKAKKVIINYIKGKKIKE